MPVYKAIMPTEFFLFTDPDRNRFYLKYVVYPAKKSLSLQYLHYVHVNALN